MVTVEPANSDAFAARLRAIVGSDSARAFARRAGVSDTFLRQCLNGHSEPTRPLLIGLAEAGRARVGWLATGEGPMRPGETETPAGPLDLDTLTGAIETVEEALASTRRTMTPAKKAALIAAVYDLFISGQPGQIEKGVVLRLVKSAS